MHLSILSYDLRYDIIHTQLLGVIISIPDQQFLSFDNVTAATVRNSLSILELHNNNNNNNNVKMFWI